MQGWRGQERRGKTAENKEKNSRRRGKEREEEKQEEHGSEKEQKQEAIERYRKVTVKRNF